jgi:lysophospholipase L1-like esterase
MTASRRKRRGVLSKLALAAGSLALTLVVLEVALRVASGFAARERGGSRAATTLLCVGDSHTYGLHVLPSQSYPARLQAELDGRPVGVVNYGVPGRNSAVVLARMPGYLEELAPAAVLILVGFNDTWNFDATPAAGGSHGFLRSLRLAKLARLAWLNVAGDKHDGDGPRIVERDGMLFVIEDGVERKAARGGAAFGTLDAAALRARVEPNLRAICAMVRESGAVPVLLTYATERQDYFLVLNELSRELAAREDVALVDLAAALRPAIASDGYESLFFGDDHPNARGNERIAVALARELETRGLVPRAAAPTPIGDAATAAAPSLELEGFVAASRRARLVVKGPSHGEFQVAFSPRREPAVELAGLTVEIGADPMLEACLRNLNLRGRTGAAGSRAIEVDLDLLDPGNDRPLFAVVAFFGGGATAPLVSPVIAIPASR